jgi:hypothetical protein
MGLKIGGGGIFEDFLLIVAMQAIGLAIGL